MISKNLVTHRMKRKGRTKEQAEREPLIYKKRDWTHKLEGLQKSTIYKRVAKGRDIERALTTPKFTHGGARTKQTIRTQ